MFYIIFLFYFLMILIVAIAKSCSGGFSSSGSDKIMRMKYEQKIQEIRRKTERLQKENERLRKIKL